MGRGEALALPGVCGDACHRLQLQPLLLVVEGEIPELQLALVGKVGIHGTGASSGG